MKRSLIRLLSLNLMIVLIFTMIAPTVFSAIDISTRTRIYEGISTGNNNYFQPEISGFYIITIATFELYVYDVATEETLPEIGYASERSDFDDQVNGIFYLEAGKQYVTSRPYGKTAIEKTGTTVTSADLSEVGLYIFKPSKNCNVYGYNVNIYDSDFSSVSSEGRVYSLTKNNVYYINIMPALKTWGDDKWASGFTKLLNGNETFIYRENNGEIDIYDYLGTEDNIEIPNRIDNKAVTGIRSSAFYGLDVNSIILPDTLKTIHDYGFDLIDNINFLGIPDSLTSIGSDAIDTSDIHHIFYEGSQSKFKDINEDGYIYATCHYDCYYYFEGFVYEYDTEYCNKIKYNCDLCSAYYTRNFSNGTKHDMEVKNVLLEATCSTPGYVYGECKLCDAGFDYETYADHKYIDYKSNNDATCSTNCTETGYCKYCGTGDTREIPDSKLAHSFTSKDSGVMAAEATCKSKQQNYVQCDKCGEVSDTKTVEIGKFVPHVYENYVSNNNPTCSTNCTETGHCKWCGKAHTQSIPGTKTPHSYTNKASDQIATAATCTKKQTNYVQCDNCTSVTKKMTVEVEIILEHNYGEYTNNNDATCEKDATQTATCKDCGYKNTVTVKDTALGHTEGEWVITKKAENGIDGEKTLFCTICNKVLDTEVIKAVVFPDCPIPSAPDKKWYSEGVYYCADRGYITGTDKGSFNPDGKLTREQFVVILARVADADLSGYTYSKFTDVKADQWYGKSVIWANESGFVNGVGDGSKFGVGQDMTREQLATMFFRYAAENGVSVDGRADLSEYIDVASIGSWAKEACAWAVDAGLIGSTRTDSKQLSPRMSVTRAQAAKIFMSYDNI
ncbi:MAG: hypothetical protein E7591_01605 [Ruminococcaceae bacterium]|nr:hypothetical protein [Oscillospiraceae bacterium]